MFKITTPGKENGQVITEMTVQPKEKKKEDRRNGLTTLNSKMGNSQTKSLKYEPQELLTGEFDYKWNDEKLVATFRFEPCEWVMQSRQGFVTKYVPIGRGGIVGIGHITDGRIALFYDVKKSLGDKVLSTGLETSAKVADFTGHELLGEILGGFGHALSSIQPDTNKLMQERAKHSCDGIARSSFEVLKGMDYEFAKTWDGIFFIKNKTRCFNNLYTFRPYYIGTGGHDNWGEEFMKILQSVGMDVVRVDYRLLDMYLDMTFGTD